VLQRVIDRTSPQFEATLTETVGSYGYKPVSHQEEAQIDADFFHKYLTPLVVAETTGVSS
jgi:hypothetical protein